jgi:tripartite ATP-independent transporter DctM subunit
VAALFMAGVIPGIVVGLSIMAASAVVLAIRPPAKASGSAAEETAGLDIPTAFIRAIPTLLLAAVVLGGILGGVFSATEASAIAVVYCFLLGMFVYREIKWADMPSIILRSAKTTSVVMLLVGASQAMSWVLAYERVPQMVSEAMLGLSANPIMVLLLINLLLLIVGTFMDMTPAVLIFTPIFLPVVMELGMDPVHFGIVIIANLCIGLCTPPVGTCLFVGCGVGKTTIARVVPSAIPFFIAMTLALMAITYIPALSLWLPRLLDLM